MMRIRFSRTSHALVAGVATTALLGLSTGAASASPAGLDSGAVRMATTACGPVCVDVSFVRPGAAAVLGVQPGGAYRNSLIQLLPGSSSASHEDFRELDYSTVAPMYCTATGQAQPGSLFTSRQCALLKIAGLLGRTAFSLAYNPDNKGPLTMCIGGSGGHAPVTGGPLRLEPCGLTAATILITTTKLPGGTTAGGTLWLISGGSNNFTNPIVATSDGRFPSGPYWSTARFAGGKAIPAQEVFGSPGPF
jgi:hypothetical protein